MCLSVCIKKKNNTDTEFVYSYKKVLKKAQKHELLKHDVILCTCSTALKPILMETMDFRQILIDECAMATEPEAFIPLVSHNPEQVRTPEDCDGEVKISLFLSMIS